MNMNDRCLSTNESWDSSVAQAISIWLNDFFFRKKTWEWGFNVTVLDPQIHQSWSVIIAVKSFLYTWLLDNVSLHLFPRFEAAVCNAINNHININHQSSRGYDSPHLFLDPSSAVMSNCKQLLGNCDVSFASIFNRKSSRSWFSRWRAAATSFWRTNLVLITSESRLLW